MSNLSVPEKIKKGLGLFFIFSALAFFHSTHYALFKKKQKDRSLPLSQTTNTSKESETKEITDPNTGDRLRITHYFGQIEKIVRNLTQNKIYIYYSDGTVK